MPKKSVCLGVETDHLPHWKIRKEKFHPPYVNADDLLINFISIIREKL